jgi:hypothetical protein
VDVGQLSDPYQQGEDDELGITISGLPGELHAPDDAPVDGPGAGDEPTDAAPADAASSGVADEGGEGVVYDLDDWSQIEREAITDRLREAGIPHGWDGTSLQVAAVDEAAVENVLDIVEGDSDRPLDGDRDQVAYDLSEWDDDHIDSLVHEMREAGIAGAWDGDELYVYAEDEQAVDELFDRVSHPHELAVEDDDGPAGGELLSEVFLVADRLRRDPGDHEGAVTLLDLDQVLNAGQPPYGLGKPEWSHLCERVSSLGTLLQADTIDEDAVIESARDLRTALRPYV